MNRRELLVGASVIAVASTAVAAGKEPPRARDVGYGPLIDDAFDCEKKGEACLTHCIAMLSTGDPAMGGCAAAVRDMLASVRALGVLATGNSKNARALAKTCGDICRDCEAECRKHDKHPVCHECAEACAKMQQEIAKL
jgi:Cys-rich four helix bundle protein (predicted Tat secretion target)